MEDRRSQAAAGARSGLAHGGERGSRWISVETPLAPVEICVAPPQEQELSRPRSSLLLLSRRALNPPPSLPPVQLLERP